METKIIMAGFGGQGIMAMGQLVAYAGMTEGKHVSWLPSYGPEMRGGTANCSVIVSDDPIGAPNIAKYDIGVFMNEAALHRFEEHAAPNATLFINESLATAKVKRTDVRAINIPVNEIADREIGNSRTANMVMLGAVLEHARIVKSETVMEVFTKVFGEKRAALKPINEQAIEAGKQFVKASLQEA